jgi:hypothetical protein|eukprot:526827-Prymnesium_polylepis.1
MGSLIANATCRTSGGMLRIYSGTFEVAGGVMIVNSKTTSGWGGCLRIDGGSVSVSNSSLVDQTAASVVGAVAISGGVLVASKYLIVRSSGRRAAIELAPVAFCSYIPLWRTARPRTKSLTSCGPTQALDRRPSCWSHSLSFGRMRAVARSSTRVGPRRADCGQLHSTCWVQHLVTCITQRIPRNSHQELCRRRIC